MKMEKEQAMMALSALILLFAALIEWSLQSWLILAGLIVIVFAWYFSKA